MEESGLREDLKKLLIKIVVIIFVIFLVVKLQHLFVIHQMYVAIEDFKKQENQEYGVTLKMMEDITYEQKTFVKENIVKHIYGNDEIEQYCEWKNLENGETYVLDLNSKNRYENPSYLENDNFLMNLPNIVLSTYRGNKLNLAEILKMRFVLLTKYQGRICYKIITKQEVIIMDLKTHLPLYCSMVVLDSNQDKIGKIEKFYEFKVGEVTEEDVALLDLSEYTKQEK